MASCINTAVTLCCCAPVCDNSSRFVVVRMRVGSCCGWRILDSLIGVSKLKRRKGGTALITAFGGRPNIVIWTIRCPSPLFLIPAVIATQVRDLYSTHLSLLTLYYRCRSLSPPRRALSIYPLTMSVPTTAVRLPKPTNLSGKSFDLFIQVRFTLLTLISDAHEPTYQIWL